MMPCIRDSETIFRVFCLSLLIAALPEFAFAHATPIQYVPAASSVLSQAPTEVQIHFSERVEPRVSSITVLAPDGSRADLSNSAARSRGSQSLPRGPERRRRRHLHGFVGSYFGG